MSDKVSRKELLLRPLLLPIAVMYGKVMQMRNFLFDKCGTKTITRETPTEEIHRRRFVQQIFPLPVVSIGNLAVGGTGKTPHTELLLRILQEKRVAVLSRGYGRKTKGYRSVETDMTAKDAGDEPLQIKRKFPQNVVAVCEDRCKGIGRLMDKAEVILLDDAFQHRYVLPTLQILLTDYHRLYSRDHMLPLGRLRESKNGARRADIIVVSKCPPELSEDSAQAITEEINPLPHQQVFFSGIVYSTPYPLFSKKAFEDKKRQSALLVSGIARPQPLIDETKRHAQQTQTLIFPDHHRFSENDLKKINTQSEQCDIVFTTEKDATRLLEQESRLSPALRKKLYVVPIRVEILFGQMEKFSKIIRTFAFQGEDNSLHL